MKLLQYDVLDAIHRASVRKIAKYLGMTAQSLSALVDYRMKVTGFPRHTALKHLRHTLRIQLRRF